MWNDAHDAYLESRVLSANPVELVGLLYQACIARVREAREHLAEGRIAERSRAICRAHEVLTELGSALDLARGGEISARLVSLYDYMRRRLIDANLSQTDEPLAEVLGLLATLSEAWDGVGQQLGEPAPQPVESAWAQPAPEEAVAAHAWSL
jgi:flagellar protein FliS